MSEANAVHSLYGGAVKRRRALAGNVGGQVRTQEVLTPESILDAAIRPAFGGVIEVDPCASSNPDEWFATKQNVSLCAEALDLELQLACTTDKDRRKELTRLLKPYYLAGSLKAQWTEGTTFVNPPFGWLKQWLARCAFESTTGRPLIGLWPLRPHRDWWVRGHAGADVVFLNYDVKFKGHATAFPAPLVLAAWNCRIPSLGKMENGRIKL